MDAGDLHKELFKAYAACYPQLSRERAQKAVNAEWKEAKEKYKNSKTPEFSNFINGRVRLYKATAPINKAKTLQSFFRPVPPVPPHSRKLSRDRNILGAKLYKRHVANRKSPGKDDVIVCELKKLEHDFSTDVAVLREQIELASSDFTEAQKRFDKLEKDYIAAKLELFVQKERKEQLTNHLCSVIKQNEIEKAKTISGFVGKLELASCPMDKVINEQGELRDKQSQDEKEASNESEENTTG